MRAHRVPLFGDGAPWPLARPSTPTSFGRASRRVAAALCVAVVLAGFGGNVASAAADREVVINLPAFRLYLYENGVRLREYPIAIGSVVEQQTVLGTTRIINRVVNPTYYPRDWWAREGVEPIPPGENNPVGTRWLGLDIPHYGIHGTNDPSSIGKPASAGCIRMYNHDVEELTELVRIGTPVHIIYRTVIVERDPYFGDWRLRVYKDLYERGTNTLDAALAELEGAGVPLDGVSLSGLQALLTQASGLATPLPRFHDVTVDGAETEIDAFRIGDRVYVAAAPVAALVGKSARWSPRWRVGVVAGETIRTGMVVNGQLYAPPADIATALGLEWHDGEGVIDFRLPPRAGRPEAGSETLPVTGS